jgi:hypothetical protein
MAGNSAGAKKGWKSRAMRAHSAGLSKSKQKMFASTDKKRMGKTASWRKANPNAGASKRFG